MLAFTTLWLSPTYQCGNKVLFYSSQQRQPLGHCSTFYFASGIPIEACAYLLNGTAMNLLTKNESYPHQAGLGVFSNPGQQTCTGTFVQLDIQRIQFPFKIMMGSTWASFPTKTFTAEKYDIYGSNSKGLLVDGTYSVFTPNIQGVHLSVPNIANYKYLGFTCIGSIADMDILISSLIEECTYSSTVPSTHTPTTSKPKAFSTLPNMLSSTTSKVVQTNKPNSLQSNRSAIIQTTYEPTLQPLFRSKLHTSDQPNAFSVKLLSSPPSISITLRSIMPTVNIRTTPSSALFKLSNSKIPNHEPSISPVHAPFLPRLPPSIAPTTTGQLVTSKCNYNPSIAYANTQSAYFITHQTIIASVTDFSSAHPEIVQVFIQSINCVLAGDYQILPLQVNITNIYSTTPATSIVHGALRGNALPNATLQSKSTERVVVQYIVKFDFPVLKNDLDANYFAQMSIYFNGLSIQLCNSVDQPQGLFATVLSEYCLPLGCLADIKVTNSTDIFGPYLLTPEPTGNPQDRNNQRVSNSAAAKYLLDNWAIITGVFAAFLSIIMCLMSAYLYYLKKKVTRENQMSDWQEEEVVVELHITRIGDQHLANQNFILLEGDEVLFSEKAGFNPYYENHDALTFAKHSRLDHFDNFKIRNRTPRSRLVANYKGRFPATCRGVSPGRAPKYSPHPSLSSRCEVSTSSPRCLTTRFVSNGVSDDRNKSDISFVAPNQASRVPLDPPCEKPPGLSRPAPRAPPLGSHAGMLMAQQDFVLLGPNHSRKM